MREALEEGMDTTCGAESESPLALECDRGQQPYREAREHCWAKDRMVEDHGSYSHGFRGRGEKRDGEV